MQQSSQSGTCISAEIGVGTVVEHHDAGTNTAGTQNRSTAQQYIYGDVMYDALPSESFHYHTDWMPHAEYAASSAAPRDADAAVRVTDSITDKKRLWDTAVSRPDMTSVDLSPGNQLISDQS